MNIFKYCNIDSKSIRAMCAALETNNVIRRFILKFNKLVRDDCYYIGLMLKNNESITVLNFTGCRLGPEGLELLMEYLPNNEVLVDLNLSKCNIRDEGMKILAYVISRNNSIEKLDLSYNKLGDKAAESLATAFKLNSSITDLNLSYNNLFNPNGRFETNIDFQIPLMRSLYVLRRIVSGLNHNVVIVSFGKLLTSRFITYPYKQKQFLAAYCSSILLYLVFPAPSKLHINPPVAQKNILIALVLFEGRHFMYNSPVEADGQLPSSCEVQRFGSIHPFSLALRGFFRSLTAFNNSISRLNLTWNGLSGPDIGGQIGNFLRRNQSIQHLDLADNSFEGLAVVEIKRGLSRSSSLETLKIGKNPMTCADLEVLLSGAKGCATLKVLDLEELWVRKNFLKILKKIQKTREIEVIIGGIYSNYEIFGPDYPKLILQRAQFEAMKPKNVKKRKDFGHLIWTLGDEPLTEEDFLMRVKKFKAKINKELFPELMKEFTNPRTQLIDVIAMRKKYLSLFPESTPPPPPKPKKGQKVPEEAAEAPAVTSDIEKIDLEGISEIEESELIIEDNEGFEQEYLEESNLEEK